MTEEEKNVIEVVRHELDYRREKQWKIFSWTVTLLLAAIAGVITLVGKGEFKFPLLPQRIAMGFALFVVAGNACRWILENIEFEGRARLKVLECLKDAGLESDILPEPGKARYYGYVTTILLVMLATVVTVLFAP